MDVLTARQKAADILQQEVLSCELMPFGLTNFSYRINTQSRSYVYRTPAPGADALVNRLHEGDAIRKIAMLDLDVPVVFFDVASGEKITLFIDTVPSAQTPPAGRIAGACTLLRRLHNSAIIFDNAFAVMDKLDQYEAVMKANGILLPSGYKVVRHRVNLLYEELTALLKGEKLVACHNDVVPENIITDAAGNNFLIDWEYAGMNDPAWDLAAYSLESGLNMEEEDELILLYFNGVCSGSIMYRMLIHKICQDVLWCLWAKIKSHFGADLLSYAEYRYKRALNHLLHGKQY